MAPPVFCVCHQKNTPSRSKKENSETDSSPGNPQNILAFSEDHTTMRSMACLVLIEADKTLCQVLQEGFIHAGIEEVCTESDGARGLATFWERDPDILVVGQNLPDMSGVEVIKNIEHKNPQPLIVLNDISLQNDVPCCVQVRLCKLFNTPSEVITETLSAYGETSKESR